MRSLVKYVVFLITPITLVVLWLAGVFHDRIEAREVQKERITVSGLKIERVKLSDLQFLSFTGSIEADKRAEISTRLMGQVVYVGVKEGERVKKGQSLIRIDVRDVRSQVQMARSRLKQARENHKMALANFEAVKKTYDRFSRLLKEGAITQQEYDQIEAKFKSAQAQLKAAEEEIRLAEEAIRAASTNIDYGEIKAPFDGVVVRKFVDKGDIAKPGYPLLIVEKSPFKVKVNLPESFLGKIKVGQRLKVRIDSVDKEFEAVVSEISPSVDTMSRTFTVKLKLEDNSSVHSGLYAKVLIPKKGKVTVLVPKEAVYRRWDFTGVWTVDPEGVLKLRLVRLGNRVGDYVEVLSGLDPEDRIVVEGLEKACNGCKVGG
jgi:RND family efflux transporter MFP subunit